MSVRTSQTHPIKIDSVTLPSGGQIGMTFCPGKCDPNARTGRWKRHLDTDLEAIKNWGACLLVTLVEDHELQYLKVPDLGDRTRSYGIEWLHLPIVDVSIPSASFISSWPAHRNNIIERLDRGESMVLHCRGGLGRTGLVAAWLLIESGMKPVDAVKQVRDARAHTIETSDQMNFVLTRQSLYP
ncbi:MAG: hypothetical protein DHS20C01_14450 [marine bacterium B5-7]|nr:MAG: hypothetical protein DHS20C01_14450 [marine bacterium B5-7]